MTQKEWKKALKKIGWKVNTKAGKGSHFVAFNPENPAQRTTVPKKVKKPLSLGIARLLNNYGYSDEDLGITR